jgi:hypothetical protein
MLEIVTDDVTIGMSDEIHFQLSGCVNKQDFHYWSEANPRQLYECPLHSEHLTVWCCVRSFGVIGPYLFEEDGHDATTNSGCYVHMLHDSSQQKLTDMELVNRPCGFIKMGPPLILREVPWQFPGHVAFLGIVIFHGLFDDLA